MTLSRGIWKRELGSTSLSAAVFVCLSVCLSFLRWLRPKLSKRASNIINLVRPMAAMLFSAISIDAFMLPGLTVTKSRTTAPAMNGEHEFHAKAAWFRKNNIPISSHAALATYKAEVTPAGPMTYGVVNDPMHDHGVEGAVHSTNEYMARIKKKQQKATKAYVGKDLELCTDRTSW
jgi:hypothetical protein